MSSGLPVVATNIGSNADIISSGFNGFLVPKCPEAMASVILDLLDNYSLRKKVGKDARRTIEENYTWDRITDKVLNCYKSIL